jgi:hypothetical protein
LRGMLRKCWRRRSRRRTASTWASHGARTLDARC